jgi:hypothetical protein
LSIFLNEFTKAGIFTDGKLIKTESIGNYDDFTWVQLYEFPNYFLVVATYCGSCFGCVGNRYNGDCYGEDDMHIGLKLPKDISNYSDALLFYKNDIFDVFKGIVLKSTIITNKDEAMNEFLSIKEKIRIEEHDRKIESYR